MKYTTNHTKTNNRRGNISSYKLNWVGHIGGGPNIYIH